MIVNSFSGRSALFPLLGHFDSNIILMCILLIFCMFFLLRLYTEKDYNSLHENTPPEMQRLELSGAVLQLKALGIDNVLRFPFPSPPPARHLVSAYELLHALAAVDDNGALTEPLGLQMAEFPLPPLHAKALLVSGLHKNVTLFTCCTLYSFTT